MIIIFVAVIILILYFIYKISNSIDKEKYKDYPLELYNNIDTESIKSIDDEVSNLSDKSYIDVKELHIDNKLTNEENNYIKTINKRNEINNFNDQFFNFQNRLNGNTNNIGPVDEINIIRTGINNQT